MARQEINTGQLSQYIADSLKNHSVPPQLWHLAGQPEDEGPYKIVSARFIVGDVLFKRYNPEIQSKVREAIVGLIDGWTIDQELRFLTDLAYVAIDIRAFASIEPLAKVVDGSLIPNIEIEDMADAAGSIMAVLGGFGSIADEETKRKLKDKLGEWINDPRLEKFAGLLINGICAADPSSYPEYMPRLLDVLRDHPDYFVVDACAMQFKEIVPEDVLREGLQRVPPEYLKDFQIFLDSAFEP